jgi:redox-regulated HSP33 family molecular chaperone
MSLLLPGGHQFNVIVIQSFYPWKTVRTTAVHLQNLLTSITSRSNNSLLVSLNARGYVRGDASTRVGTSSHSTGTAAQHAIPMKRAHGTYTSDTVDGNGTSAIHITTDTVTDNRYVGCVHLSFAVYSNKDFQY